MSDWLPIGILVACVLAVVATYVVWQLSQKTTPREYHVVLTHNGFLPEAIVLKEGDSIVFTSEVDASFWPASDLHPTHTLYAAFDPQAPVASGASWRFTFTQPGSWKYHDHLNPLHKGVVVVLGEAEWSQVHDCSTLSGSSKFQCFDTLLEEKLAREGIEAAFSYFVDMYKNNPDVGGVCHGWAHRLGEVEYGLYADGKDVSLRPEATFCSYGYFHGFISAMVEATQSLETALQFCDEATAQNKDGLQNLHNNCVHGIGHSIATLQLEDEAYWGDFNKNAEGGFGACERLFKPGPDLNICYDGMIHELRLSLIQETYGMSNEAYKTSGDLFYYCHSFEGQHKESCFYDFVNLWPTFYDDDETSAMRYVLPYLEDMGLDAIRSMRTFARSFIEGDIATGEYQDSVDACALATGDFYDSCVGGLTSGFVEHGEPNNMHVEGFAFCDTYYIAEDRQFCFDKMIESLSWSYDKEHMALACASLPSIEKPKMCSPY